MKSFDRHYSSDTEQGKRLLMGGGEAVGFAGDSQVMVLLVDDEKEFIEALAERLVMRKMEAIVTYDGRSALELLSKKPLKTMVLDLQMPGIDGLEVLRMVKKSYPMVEVIVLSAHGAEAEKKECMKLGAFACFNKPVDISLLGETLKMAFEKWRMYGRA
ncbi:MAG: response regulator [Pseudomonadota bacterium]